MKLSPSFLTKPNFSTTSRMVMLFLTILLFGFKIKNYTLAPELSEKFVISVSNNSNVHQEDAVVYIAESVILSKYPNFNKEAFVVMEGEQEIPSQYKEGLEPGIIVIAELMQAGEEKEYTIKYALDGQLSHDYPKRTQAELSHKTGGHFEGQKYIGGEFTNITALDVPKEHTDHSYYLRYEGPGWESDKVGYRYYLDWRNAIDVFGKKTAEPILHKVGHDNFDSYHDMSDWGMDVLKVGKSLGVGALAVWEDGKARRIDNAEDIRAEIVENGNLYSEIKTSYTGWESHGKKRDLISVLSIAAGSRLTKHIVSASEATENFSTGLIKDSKAKLIKSDDDLTWSYMASYGKQSLAEDHLGIAVIYKTSSLIEQTEDEFSHVVKLSAAEQPTEYYFLAAWEQEPEGIRSEEAFVDYLEHTIAAMSSPLTINLK